MGSLRLKYIRFNIMNNQTIEFFDCHFHIWDIMNDRITDKEIIRQLMNKWDWNNQIKVINRSLQKIKLLNGIFVEVIPDDNQCINEVWWARKEFSKNEIFLCPRVNLSKSFDYVDVCLNTMCKMDKLVVSIRDILNFEPSWPKIKMNMMKNKNWKSNFSLLSRQTLAADFQANPDQLKNLALFFAKHPNTNVIINHLGLLKNPDSDFDLKQWRQGMRALSKLSHVYAK